MSSEEAFETISLDPPGIDALLDSLHEQKKELLLDVLLSDAIVAGEIVSSLQDGTYATSKWNFYQETPQIVLKRYPQFQSRNFFDGLNTLSSESSQMYPDQEKIAQSTQILWDSSVYFAEMLLLRHKPFHSYFYTGIDGPVTEEKCREQNIDVYILLMANIFGPDSIEGMEAEKEELFKIIPPRTNYFFSIDVPVPHYQQAGRNCLFYMWERHPDLFRSDTLQNSSGEIFRNGPPEISGMPVIPQEFLDQLIRTE